MTFLGLHVGYKRPRLKPKSPDCQFYGLYVLHFSILWEMADEKSRRGKETQCDLPTYEDLTSSLCTMESSAKEGRWTPPLRNQ